MFARTVARHKEGWTTELATSSRLDDLYSSRSVSSRVSRW